MTMHVTIKGHFELSSGEGMLLGVYLSLFIMHWSRVRFDSFTPSA
jgi:hypothetical protein